MKKLIKIFIVIGAITFYSCDSRILIKNAHRDELGFNMFGQVPQRNFYVNEELGDSLQLIWETNSSGGYINSQLTIYDKFIFTADLSGKLYCFDNQTGAEIGFEKYKGVISTSPIIDHFRIAFLLNELEETYSTLFIYNYYNGKMVSKFEIDGNCDNQMLKVEDHFFVLSNNGTLFKINVAGVLVWKIETGVETFCSPAANDKEIYWGNSDGEIISASIETGEINYTKESDLYFSGGVTIDENYGYAGDVKGSVVCFNLNDGEIVWEYFSGIKINAVPAHDDSSLFCGNIDGDIFCIDKSSGEEIWKLQTGGIINSTPLVFNDVIVQPEVNKRVFIINKENGDVKKIIKYDRRARMTPVFYNGILYLGSDLGNIYAYKKPVSADE